MAKYRVKDNKTGRVVTFEWHMKEPPTEVDLNEIFAEAGQKALEATQLVEKEKPGVLSSVGVGHREAAAGFYDLLAAIPYLYRQYEELVPGNIGLGRAVEEPLREIAQSIRPTAKEMEGREGVVHGVARGIGGLPTALATYAPAIHAAGPVGGMAIVDALRRAEQGPVGMVKGAATGAATGMGLQATRFIPTKVGRGLGTGGFFGGMAAVEGGDVTDVTTSALLGSVLGLSGEGKQRLVSSIPPEYLKPGLTKPLDAGAEFKQTKMWPRWRPTPEERTVAKVAARAEVTKVEPQWKPPSEQAKLPMRVPRNIKQTEAPATPVPPKAKPASVAKAKPAPVAKAEVTVKPPITQPVVEPTAKPTVEPVVEVDRVQARLYRVHTSDGSVAYFTKAEQAEAFPDSQGVSVMEMKRPLAVGSVEDISKVNMEDYKAAGYEAIKDNSSRVVVFNNQHVGYRGNLTEGEFQPIETSELSKLVVEAKPPTWREPAVTPPVAKPTIEQARAVVMAKPGMQKTYEKIIQTRGKTAARDWLDRQVDDYRNGANLWSVLGNEKGGVKLIEGLGGAYEALYKAGVYLDSRLGTRGKIDLGPLQDRIRRFLSPHYLAEVEPYPDRFVDFLKGIGVSKKDMETIAKTGGKVSFATQGDLKKAAIRAGYYNPKTGGSFIETLKKDMLSAYYGEGEPVYSVKKGAPQAIVKGGLEYELWKKRTEEGLERIAHKAYEELTPKQQSIVVDLLRNFTSKSEIPEWVVRDYPAEVKAFHSLREHIFNPLYRAAKQTDPTVKPYLDAYFPIIYKEFKRADIGRKAYLIKAFAREHGINEALAERIIERGLPKKAYYGHLKESRKLQLPAGLEQELDLGTVVGMYIHGTVRFTGLNRWLPEARQHLSNIPLESNIHKAMEEYVKTLSGYPLADDTPLPKWLHQVARVEGTRQIITKLGFNLAGAAVNYSQWFINSGTQALANSYEQGSGHPMYRFAEATAKAWTRKGQRIASRSGIFTDVGKGELRVKDIHGVLGKVAGVTTYIFDAAERLNKAGEWARVYQDNIQAGRVKGLVGKELLQYAKRESIWSEAKTQFFMGAGDRPIGLAGPGLSTMARFKVFTIKQLEYMANLRGAEKAAFIATILLLDGPQGVGFDIVHGELEEHFPDSEVVKDLSQVQKYLQDHSLSGLLGIELTGKIGIGFFPGLENSARVWSSLLEGESLMDVGVLGGVTVRDMSNAFSDIAEGRLLMSIEQIGKAALDGELSLKDFQSLQHAITTNKTSFALPIGVRRMLKAEEVGRTGKIRGRTGEIQERAVGPTDIAKVAIGLQSEKLVQRKEAVWEYKRELDHAKWRKEIITVEWQDAIKRGDQHKLRLLKEQLVELNKEWVGQGIPPLSEGLITSLKGKELGMELRGIPPVGRARLLKEKRRRDK